MAVHLLDVNALVALFWNHHQHHSVVEHWFLAHADAGWATCPLTECGFIRISSNPRMMIGAVTPLMAIESLRELSEHPRHEFWADDVSISGAGDPVFTRLSGGHQQVTDAYLIALAVRHGGRLVTLDRAAAKLGTGDVELLAP